MTRLTRNLRANHTREFWLLVTRLPVTLYSRTETHAQYLECVLVYDYSNYTIPLGQSLVNV